VSIEPAPPGKGWIFLRRLPRESDLRAVVMTLIVCVVCSAAITFTVSTLRPYREAHRVREQQAKIEQMIAAVPGLEDVLSGASGGELQALVIDLERGDVDPAIDPETFDASEAARDEVRSIALAPEEDLAGLGRRARHARVYTISDAAGLRLLVLPVEGAGYISTLRGYLALDGDLRTIRGLSFYEHGETPGLGSEIESPAWRALWPGKRAFDAGGRPRIAVIRGRPDPASPDAVHQVDGITGATLTGDGVTRLLQFWLGPRGFGPYLARLAETERAGKSEDAQ
jgi:Na+-transporting NADH:ubiquinone oxidoreductase subunit C